MQGNAETMAELQRKGLHLVREAELLCLREHRRNLVSADAGAHARNCRIHPAPRSLVGVPLRIRRAADTEGAVVAGAVAHIRLDDVEERLVAGADQPVGEVVRVRAAALTGHRVHRLNVVGPHRIEHVVDAGDDVRLAHTRFQLLVDHVIRAVHHRCRRIEQHDLVAALDLACIEQCLLAVTYVDPKVLQFEQHRRFDHIDPQRHVTDAVFIEHGLDLERRSLDQASVRGNRSA